MNPNDLPAQTEAQPATQALTGADLLAPMLGLDVSRAPDPAPAAWTAGVVVGELLAVTDDGLTPLVRFPGQIGSGAVRARSCVDLHGPHIGAQLVLMFEDADPQRPLVMGVLRGPSQLPLTPEPGHVELDADGQRLIVSAKEQLVLRCGKASITLTKAGKVLIEGSYISSRSTGVNRVKGGSVQLN